MQDDSDTPSVYLDDTFKPPDRSTSAPPVMSLQTESLFAFRAAAHMSLFSDIRCEDNYYEFYKRHQNQEKLPPPLQNQPFYVGGSVFPHEEEHLQQQQHQQQHIHQQQHVQQHVQQQQHMQQSHIQPPQRGGGYEPRYSVASEARNVPPARSNSNPPYARQNTYDAYDASRIVDDIPSESPSETIWTPLYRKMANLVLDEEDRQEKQRMQPNHNHNHNHNHQQRRDAYYQNHDFDSAFSTANQLLKEDTMPTTSTANNIQSLWSDRAFDTRQQNYRKHNPSISSPSPVPAQTSTLLSLLSNGKNHDHHSSGGYFADMSSSPIDAVGMHKMTQHRRASSGERLNNMVPSTASPPPANSSSPNLPTCRYFAQGYCSRGERCNYSHDGETTQAQHPPVPSPTTPPPSVIPTVEPLIFGKGNNKKKGTPSPPLPSILAALGGGMTTSSGMHMGMDNGKKSVGAQPSTRSPVGARSNGSVSEISFPNGLSSPSASTPTPLSPSSVSSPSKTDLTRQYTSIEQVVGHIYSLCKDQHGCRFLQKKLEDREPNVAEHIFAEVYDHMTELMTDPFGNYLCQKLLEHCNDAQRLEVIQRVSGDLVKISKNMHGTRAVQKMIEYLTTPAQIALVKKALANSVVTLIQDLNGNHVIQRCLNRLSPQDNQFIYDSVSQAGHCVEVATHRHGCCVLQRCIDHASDSQKVQLINEVIANALVLVQDPYGNYVVQYVLDLNFPGLASELARRFLGHIPILSTQKFSSNVIEKCLNVADATTRAFVIQELVEYDNLLYLLQDPYANYVIQTSLNVSEPMQHARLVEAIRPHLTALRNTPYGKRIQNKILKESSRDYYA